MFPQRNQTEPEPEQETSLLDFGQREECSSLLIVVALNQQIFGKLDMLTNNGLQFCY